MTFEEWWNSVGSGIVKLQTEDNEEHARKVASAAWISARKDTLIECSNIAESFGEEIPYDEGHGGASHAAACDAISNKILERYIRFIS
jgi:hypothetical protein